MNYYELRFEIEFLRTEGDAFQTFFERLMGLAYKADFMACCSWGKDGDRKNDGYLKSARRLFQVYAPNEMDAAKAKAKAKIATDFEGARQHWGKDFDKWTFVHNATDGLPPHVLELMLSFERANPGIKLDPWCLEELRPIFRMLSDEDRESWFGAAVTEETAVRLGFADLKVVLERIEGLPAPHVAEVKDVPPGKIEANALSPAVTQLLHQGLIKSYLVAEFLCQWHDQTLGERLAEAFKAEYKRLRGVHSPNQTFAELQAWAGGDRRGSPEHELAVLTVMAYYFERCDIFEAPRSPVR
jgi:hypothetical protein